MRTLRALGSSAIYLFILGAFTLSCVLPPGAVAAPLIEITRPEDGSFVSGESYIDVAYRGEPGNPIVAIQLFLDGQKVKEWRLTTPQQSGKQSFPWNFALSTGETHVISAAAIDAQGQKGNATVNVRVQKATVGGSRADKLPPVIKIFYPAHGARLSGIQKIKADGEDDTGITTVFFYVDGKFKSMIMNAPPYVYDWDTTKYSDGPHVLKVAAFDAAENRGESAEVTVFVDNKSLTMEGAGIPTIEPSPSAPFSAGPEGPGASSPPPAVGPRVQSFQGPVEVAWTPTPTAPEVPVLTGAPRVGEPGRSPAVSVITPPAPPRVTTPPAPVKTSAPSGPGLQPTTPAPRPAASRPNLAALTPLPSTGPAAAGMRTPAPPAMPYTGSAHLACAPGGMTSSAVSPGLIAPEGRLRSGLPSGSPRLAPRTVFGGPTVAGISPPAFAPLQSSGNRGEVGVATTPLVAEGLSQVVYGQPILTVSPARNAQPPGETTVAGVQPPAPRPVPEAAPQTARAAATDEPQRLASAWVAAPPSRPSPARVDTPSAGAVSAPTVAMSPGMGRPPLSASPGEPRSLVDSSVPVAIANIRNIQIVFNGERLNLRSLPEIAKGVPVAALREIFEHTNGVLYWFPQEKKVRAVSDEVDMSLRIGDPRVQVNEETKTLELAPYLKRGRTMVPLQFIADTLKVTITFNPDSGQIVISSNEF